MTSLTPVSPLYPINDTNPPPRKRQRDEGKEMNEELSNDEEETQYSPAGGGQATSVRRLWILSSKSCS